MIRLSNRSKTPPFPGMMLKKSFMQSILLIKEKIKSPAVADTAIINPDPRSCTNFNPGIKNENSWTAASVEKMPPNNPSQVF